MIADMYNHVLNFYMLRGSIVFLLIATTLSGYCQGIDTKQAQSIATGLLISKNYTASVKKILPPINNIQAIVLNVPYREYPGIVLVHKVADKWQIVFEAFGPGIQDKKSNLLDWHIKKTGTDFSFENKSLNDFQDKQVRAAIELSFKKDDVVLIPYQHFFHLNTAENLNPRKHTAYTIDKTRYFYFANILFDGRYNKYPKNECIMFDTPQIQDCSFTFTNNLYKIVARTTNGQVWIYSFSGIDADGKYLIDKKINVEKASVMN